MSEWRFFEEYMNPREIVLEQVNHRATETVPYTFALDEVVAEGLDEHYGDTPWREKLIPYMVHCGGIDRRKASPLKEGYNIDPFGSVWRIDRRPFHLEKPGMAAPSFDGYDFPTNETFANPDLQSGAEKALQENPDSFSILSLGWGLWETYWGIRGFENAMMDVVAEPEFMGALLDRLTDMYLDQISWCKDIPVDGFFFGDDWGGQRGVLIGPDSWRKLFKPRYARIYAAAHEQGKCVMSHSCGSVYEIIPDIIEIGLDA
ncbi:uroporphyrinogen decarboxylase family protein [Planctomycetota bacterium]